MTRVVIVGSSVGGVRTAQALRAEGYDGQICLVGEELELPYDKPPLSKALLAGRTDAESIRLLTREEAEDAQVRLLLGHRAVGLNVARGTVELENHVSLRYDQVVVATGARPRPSPWGAREGVHVLRSLQDAESLRSSLLRGGHVVVVGGGFIGAEVASTARLLGLETTMVDPLSVPMSRVLTEEIGEWFIGHHRRHGIRSLFGVGVEGIGDKRGKLEVKLTDGHALHADTVVVGIGVQPNDDWLGSSGLVVSDGLVSDEYCRAVNAPNVYAVGDVARWFHRDHGVQMRAEHWTNAVEQANCVAYNITHPSDLRSYAPVEYVWSDQHDWKIQVVGRVGGFSVHAVVGDPAMGKFAALYAKERPWFTGAVIVNWPRALIECRRALSVGGDLGEVTAKLSAHWRKRSDFGSPA